MRQDLKDRLGHRIGYIEDCCGRKYIYDHLGHRLGYYDGKYTYDHLGHRIGQGDLLTTLLKNRLDVIKQ